MNEDTTGGTALIPHSRLTEILSAREGALAAVDEALRLMDAGYALASKAKELATIAHKADRYYEQDRSKRGEYQRIFEPVDVALSRETFRRELDASTWVHILRVTGLENLMDREAMSAFLKDLAGNVPEVTADNVQATVEALANDSHLIFGRGLANVFASLDRRFKSHDAFKIGSRIVLTHIFDSWGSFNYRVEEILRDVERVFCVLDQQSRTTPEMALATAIRNDRGGGFNPRQSLTETSYFRARAWKNGNLHLWFTRDDLVEKANQVLANYYGEVLPDGVPGHEETLRGRKQTTAVSKDLAFYPTPPDVARLVFRKHVCTHEGMRMLEPSAGAGALVAEGLKAGCMVDAIEVDAGRVATLRGMARGDVGLVVHHANFLDVPPVPIYDLVVMNPPFYGRHWISHVMHAWEFLAPGGQLVSILPVTAQVSETAEHLAFREWVSQKGGTRRDTFTDLPAESFRESGVRINTVVLELHRKQHGTR